MAGGQKCDLFLIKKPLAQWSIEAQATRCTGKASAWKLRLILLIINMTKLKYLTQKSMITEFDMHAGNEASPRGIIRTKLTFSVILYSITFTGQ